MCPVGTWALVPSVFILLIQDPLCDLRSKRLQTLVAILIPISDLFLEAAPRDLQFPNRNQSIGDVFEKPCDRYRCMVHRLVRQLGSWVIVIFDLCDLDVLLVAIPTELTLHIRNLPGELGQHTFDVADINIPLFEGFLQMCDPLFVATGKFFRLTLPLEVVVQKLSMTVGPPVQGLRVGVNSIHEGIPHLLLERLPLLLQLVVLLTL